jgi:hypothetical protein
VAVEAPVAPAEIDAVRHYRVRRTGNRRGKHMVDGPVSGTVYIWYPKDGRVGHASMYIGDIDIGSKFDQFIGQVQPASFVQGVTHHMNDNYVSWWPDDDKDLLTTKSEPMNELQDDVDSEGHEQAHVKYTLYGLDKTKMRAKWHSIRGKQDSHYKLHIKNCSTIVARVLRAGGASELAGAKSIWFAHNMIWTPKKVAGLCNVLRDKGYATKDRWNCPMKNDVSKLYRFFGMR